MQSFYSVYLISQLRHQFFVPNNITENKVAQFAFIQAKGFPTMLAFIFQTIQLQKELIKMYCQMLFRPSKQTPVYEGFLVFHRLHTHLTSLILSLLITCMLFWREWFACWQNCGLIALFTPFLFILVERFLKLIRYFFGNARPRSSVAHLVPSRSISNIGKLLN